jgi:hypothetical protein
MEILVSQTSAGDWTPSTEEPVFRVVIAYEDFAAGKHAQETYDYLVQRLEGELELDRQMWKFDVLKNLKMRELAVEDAAAADLIIISTHGMGDLPEGVWSWIDRWVAHEGSAMALVTLVDRPRAYEGEDNPIRFYLQRVARRAGMDFFAQPNEWPDKDEDFSLVQIAELAQHTSTLMMDFLHHSVTGTRWGMGNQPDDARGWR